VEGVIFLGAALMTVNATLQAAGKNAIVTQADGLGYWIFAPLGLEMHEAGTHSSGPTGRQSNSPGQRPMLLS
jgi:hypothetical protein